MSWIFGGKECCDFSTALGLAWGLGKHSGAKAVKLRGAKAIGKTHSLELSSLFHSIHTFFVIFMFVDNLATSFQVLLVVF
jgi:hypothetical protein